MDSTSISLLRRLREPEPEAAWRRFVDLYAPLIYHWGRNQGLNSTDTSDLVQEVMAILVVKLPDFEYDPAKRFRGWLRTVTINKARDFKRRQLTQPATGTNAAIGQAVVADEVDLFDEVEYRQYLVGRALRLMQAEFRETTWQACWKSFMERQSTAEISRELGLSPNAVHIAKSRVLRRLRAELNGLLD